MTAIASHRTADGGRSRRWLRMLGRAIAWDLRLQARYHILTVVALVTVAYAVVFRVLPVARSTEVVGVLIFSDPTMIGFLFLGVLVLFERGAGTLDAIVVTPLTALQYLWSKALSLTIVAVSAALLMGVAARGVDFDPVTLAVGTLLSSVLFVFVGFVAVARVRSVNEYLLLVPVYLMPLVVPLLAFFGLVESPLFHVVPTHASLVLVAAAFDGRPAWEIVYGIAYLMIAVGVALWLARRAYETHVRRGGVPR